jgi:lysozyme
VVLLCGSAASQSIDGIDVSAWQGYINWFEVYNAGYRFAFARASLGDETPPLLIDEYFEINMEEGAAAGMLMGAYHFAYPDYGTEADSEARHFLNIAGPYLTNEYLRPVLDLERGASLGKTALSNWMHEWMDTVKTETGIEPLIYTNSYYANNYLDSSISQYDLWIAHWTCDPAIPPNTGIWDSWDFWQYWGPSGCGPSYVPGISGNVDLDLFNGDISGLNTFKISVGDFDDDGDVDFADYATLASRWMDGNCGASNDCDGADINFSGTVDLDDLRIFCYHWLENSNW